MTSLEEIILPSLPPGPKQPSNPEIVKALRQATYSDIYALPANQMKRLSKLIREARKEKYDSKSHTSKYRGVVRIPTREQLRAIMATIKTEKVKLCFRIMAIRGLRPNEVVRLKKQDIFALQYEGISNPVPIIRVNNTKSNRVELCTIPVSLYAEIMAYIEKHRLRILTHDGYLFYSTRPKRKKKHISTLYLRNAYRKACKKCGLTKTYADIYNPAAKNGIGHRHNLSLYGLRGFAITEFYRATHDIKLTQQFARHEHASTTLDYYIYRYENELVNKINTVYQKRTAMLNI